MPVSVPWAYTEGLVYDIEEYTQATLSQAAAIVSSIRLIAVSAAESALDLARSHTDVMTSAVREDVTGSLNVVSEILSDQVFDLRQYIIEEMVPALEAIGGAGGGVSDEIGEEIVKAYDAIADSRKLAGEVVENSIKAAGEWIGETYETVSTFVNDGVMAAVAMVGDTVIEITKGIDRYAQSVLDVLIPAEMRALFQTVGDILMGDPIRMLFDYGGRVFKTQLSEVLTIDDKELQTWIGKARLYMEDIAMQAAKPGGAT